MLLLDWHSHSFGTPNRLRLLTADVPIASSERARPLRPQHLVLSIRETATAFAGNECELGTLHKGTPANHAQIAAVLRVIFCRISRHNLQQGHKYLEQIRGSRPPPALMFTCEKFSKGNMTDEEEASKEKYNVEDNGEQCNNYLLTDPPAQESRIRARPRPRFGELVSALPDMLVLSKTRIELRGLTALTGLHSGAESAIDCKHILIV